MLYESGPLTVVDHGKDELRDFREQVFDAFRDFNIELTTQSLRPDWAMLEWIMSGTHQGHPPGIPVTRKRFSVTGAAVIELEDGRISRDSDYRDMGHATHATRLMPSWPDGKRDPGSTRVTARNGATDLPTTH